MIHSESSGGSNERKSIRFTPSCCSPVLKPSAVGGRGEICSPSTKHASSLLLSDVAPRFVARSESMNSEEAVAYDLADQETLSRLRALRDLPPECVRSIASDNNSVASEGEPGGAVK